VKRRKKRKKKNTSAMNVAVNGHEAMEEVVLMATLLVSYVRSTTIAETVMTLAKHVTCAISTHVKEQTILMMNAHTLTYGRVMNDGRYRTDR
jgi:hypothetical protein